MGRTPFAATLCALLGGAAVAPPMTEGPPAGFTGGFGEPTCLQCHTGSEVNAYGGRAYLRGLPTSYEPGRDYVLGVVLEADETATAGFQLTSRFAATPMVGRNAGSLEPLDARVALRDSAGISYAHQSLEGAPATSPGGSSWSVAWTAPTGGGPVRLNLAANSGNGDNSPLGDLVYLFEAIVPPAPSTTGPGPSAR